VQCWANDRASWKFNKVLQNYMLEAVLSANKMDKNLFRVILPYLASIQGGARDRLQSSVQKIIDGDNDTGADEAGGEDGDAEGQKEAVGRAQSDALLKRAIKIQSALAAT
jgi:hypothetical protein